MLSQLISCVSVYVLYEIVPEEMLFKTPVYAGKGLFPSSTCPVQPFLLVKHSDMMAG